MLIRAVLKQEEAFGSGSKKEKKGEHSHKQKDPKAVKVHNENMSTQFNQIQQLDRDFKEASGVSPIRYRHDIDLYGVSCGMGSLAPILLENLNRLPDPEEYEDPRIVKKNAAKEAKEKEKADAKAAKEGKKPPAPKPAKAPAAAKKGGGKQSKLVLTNS